MSNVDVRRRVLQSHGADSETLNELLAFNENVFTLPDATSPPQFPLPDEPFVSTWSEYAQQAQPGTVFDFLQQRLVQLYFPIRAGISQDDEYRAVTRRGESPENVSQTTGLCLRRPDLLSLSIHQTHAGKVPILIAPDREDFVSLLRALTARNEPEPVPDSMGACIISGYNNWDRIRRYRATWSQNLATEATEEDWQAEFRNMTARKELYQDRFILLSCGFYSSVSPETLGVTSEQWRECSLIIRREHECMHYFTRRAFRSMRNHVLDELIADYVGLIAATGRFPADWFLRFMGLEDYPAFRPSGRLSCYRGTPAISDKSFRVLQRILIAAAESLERFSTGFASQLFSLTSPMALITLSAQTIEELAAPEASRVLLQLITNSTSSKGELTPCEN
jgi:hypothetical protein